MHKKVGFLGLGTMGLPMAKRLLQGGVSLVVTQHANPRPVEELAEQGAEAAQNVQALLASVDVVISILPADAQLNEVFLHPANLEALRPGTVLLDMTTAAPNTLCHIASVLATKGVGVVDAPVSGGVRGAVDGTLSFFCGAAPEQVALVADLFPLMGKSVFYCGDVGAGKIMKSVNQMLAAAHTVLTAEALHMVKSLGLNVETACSAISASSGASTMFKSKFMKMNSEDFSPNFSLQLMQKDLNIATSISNALNVPVMQAAASCIAEAAKSNPDMDIAGVYARYRQ